MLLQHFLWASFSAGVLLLQHFRWASFSAGVLFAMVYEDKIAEWLGR